jgi:hypothetical protein
MHLGTNAFRDKWRNQLLPVEAGVIFALVELTPPQNNVLRIAATHH